MNQMKTGLLVLMSAALLGACEDKTTVSTPTTPDRSEVVVTGQLVEAQTMAPVEDVEVRILVDGARYLVTQSANSDDQLMSGRFTISGIPAGEHLLIVEADGYAPLHAEFQVGSGGSSAVAGLYFASAQSSDGNLQLDTGKLVLSRPVTADIRVTAEGENVPGAPVTATPLAYLGDCGLSSDVNTSMIGESVVISSDTDGKASFDSLSRCVSYRFSVPALDLNNDGTYEYNAFVTTENYKTRGNVEGIVLADYSTPINLPLTPNTTQSQLSIIYHSGKTDVLPGALRLFGTNQNSRYGVPVIDPGKNLLVSFNMPATVTGSVGLEGNGYLLDAANPRFGGHQTLSAVVALDDEGLTLTAQVPAQGWPANHLIRFAGVLQTANGDSLNLADDDTWLYVPVTGAPEILAATASNFDGYSNEVVLIFSEYVTGEIRLLEINGSPVARWRAESEYSFLSHRSIVGCTTACSEVVYSAGFNAGASSGDVITVAVDVTDAEGNRLNQAQTLTLQ